MVIPKGNYLNAVASWSRSLSKGQVFTKQKTITVKQPGYYHVLVSVHAKNAKKFTKGGIPILNGSWNHAWIWINPKGGKVTRNFQYKFFPKNIRPVPGPLTKLMAAPQFQYGQKRVKNLTNAITVKVNYRDKSVWGGGYKPLKNATVTYKEGFHNGTVHTNDQGIATIPCFASANSYTIKVFNKNNKVKVFDFNLPSSTFAIKTEGLVNDCGYTVVLNSQNSYLFANFNQVIANSRSFFQHSRGQISVYRQHTGGVSNYHPNGDYINIAANSVGTRYGNFGNAHEYGHALQSKKLGGIPAYTCSPDGHYISGEYNLGCAYGEGFADYHAAVTSTNINHYFAVENDPYVNNGEDGSIIEGAVAAFLYDLTDPGNESFDNADYPGSYIADIIQSCQVKVNGSWKRANGIDELIACLQNKVPYYSSLYGHFPTRNPIPYAYQENVNEPSSWNQNDIATLWYKDLYNEDYANRPLNVSITGLSFISSNGSYTWQANVEDGDGSYSYQWQWKKPRAGGSWVNVGTSDSYTRNIVRTDQLQQAVLRVIVTSGSRQGTGYQYLTITQRDCPPHQLCH